MRISYIIISTLFACALLAFIEHGMAINYGIKTMFKIGFFFIIIFGYIILFKDFRLSDPLNIHKMSMDQWLWIIVLGIASASAVFIAYILLNPILNVNNIKDDLVDRLGITPLGFIFVGVYVAFVNSFLEEYFFRGFIFFNLPKKLGYIYSPLLFSSYHIPMIVLWFSPLLVFLCFLGLWLIGFIFHRVNEKNSTIWASWIIHVCADIIIILIGITIFY